MDRDNRSLIDTLREYGGLISAIVTFASTIIAFLLSLQENTFQATIVLLAMALVSGWLGCLHVWRKRRPAARRPFLPPPPRKNLEAYHPPWARYLALIGLILLPLLPVGGFAFYQYQRFQRSQKVIILVANFDGPEQQKFQVTRRVHERLESALEEYEDVLLERVAQTFASSTDARAVGENNQADIVIWGWYGTTDPVQLSVHFEVLEPPHELPEFDPMVQGAVRQPPLAELESAVIQTRLSQEMAYLSLFTVGLARYAADDWDGAIDRFSAALHQLDDPVPALNQNVVHFYRGVAYYATGEYPRAIADYNKAIELEPDDALAYTNRGNAYAATGEYPRAIADYNKAIELQPDFVLAYINRGLAYYAIEEYPRAIADCNKAIELQPDFAAAYINRGLAYAATREYPRAIADYNKAIELQPDFALAYTNRGAAYAATREYPRAIADYNKAIELQPDDAQPYFNRGNAYALTGEYPRAIADYNKAIELQPDFALAYINRGLAYVETGEYPRAIADFTQTIELQPCGTTRRSSCKRWERGN